MFKVTSYSIAIPINARQWEILQKYSYDAWNENETKQDEFYKTMKNLGAENIEYNGHFGMCFYCDVETLEQAENITKKLLEFYLK